MNTNNNFKINLPFSPFLVTGMILLVLKLTGLAVIPIAWWVIALITFFPVFLALGILAFGAVIALIGCIAYGCLCLWEKYTK